MKEERRIKSPVSKHTNFIIFFLMKGKKNSKPSASCIPTSSFQDLYKADRPIYISKW